METVPKVLTETMTEEIVYNAFRDGGYIRNVPEYVAGSYYLPEACAEEFRRLGVNLSQDVFWNAIADAHEAWRARPEIMAMVLSEDCANCLNVFVRSELAGLEAFLVWARKLERYFRLAGFDFDQGFNKSGFSAQLAWVQEVHWDLPSVMAGIFLENRRRFAEQSGLVGQRDLYEYVTNTGNDVLGACAWRCDEPRETCTTKVQIKSRLYTDDNDSLTFRLTRQILRANGDKAPVSW